MLIFLIPILIFAGIIVYTMMGCLTDKIIDHYDLGVDPEIKKLVGPAVVALWPFIVVIGLILGCIKLGFRLGSWIHSYFRRRWQPPIPHAQVVADTGVCRSCGEPTTAPTGVCADNCLASYERWLGPIRIHAPDASPDEVARVRNAALSYCKALGKARDVKALMERGAPVFRVSLPK